MNIEHFIVTYNRAKIAGTSINSLLNNTSITPRAVWIIDDGSEPEFQTQLFNFSQTNKNKLPINLVLHARNKGIGHTFEVAYSLIDQSEDLDIACFIESDYIFRQGFLEDIEAVFEANENILAIAGTNHEDMYNRQKTHGTFVDLMKEQFSKDLSSRQNLYQPYDLDTKLGKIKVQGVSNSCGCMMIHWKRLKAAINRLEVNNLIQKGDYQLYLNRAFNKGVTHDTRANASDAYLSQTISMFSEMDMSLRGVDITKNFGFVSICDFNISSHRAGMGRNGMIVPEGETFMDSPGWKHEYLKVNPRQ